MSTWGLSQIQSQLQQLIIFIPEDWRSCDPGSVLTSGDLASHDPADLVDEDVCVFSTDVVIVTSCSVIPNANNFNNLVVTPN